jgi:hypothetical protein
MGKVEELKPLRDYSIQMVLSKDQRVIKTFSPHASQEPLADRIRLWRTIRRLQDFDGRPHGDPCEGLLIFTIAIPNQKMRRLIERRGLTQLLCDPGTVG